MQKATELGNQPGWHQLNQYKNPANPDAHFRTTGPEVWKQTGGKITHFVAGLGTCGTITGTGRFLKSKNKDIKTFGVHPSDGHDIPGVRSFKALKLTDFFLPNEYNGIIEIDNEEAYRLCKRLNQEESIIAGPSSGMALAGALKLVPDEPGNICVVMFPDNIFKYTASIKKHLPELFPGERQGSSLPSTPPAPSPEDVIDPTDTIDRVIKGAILVDVRTPDEFRDGHIAEALNLPLQAIQAGKTDGLPADKKTPIVTLCAVGKRSAAACALLKGMGYENVKTSRGGMNSWIAEGNPLQIL
jgi:rhodanese-related sulfurtransferase